MGVVYLAEQEQPIARQVALKVVKLGMDTRAVLSRFRAELQALALMDHPNIAHVYDAGSSPEGRPYFVMEYVPGVPITQYCDERRLNQRERLELFCSVCRAVHHAHQKGIIHRDIKPSNILVQELDGKPVPKIIDFGLAKAIGTELDQLTAFTVAGIFLGTPAYMSPEQANGTGHDLDTATDIYSLGIVLYELLAGAPPFAADQLRKAGRDEICRLIREQEPPTPAARLQSLGATAAEVADRRRSETRSLLRALQGDLNWITMRAIEKERARRYSSASEFAADIERHLRNEPVQASPPGIFYRLGKYVRRNRATALSAAAVCLALFGGTIVSTALYFQARAESQEAEWQTYLANIAAADALLDARDETGAQDRLLKVKPAQRGWEWRYRWARSDPSLATFGVGFALRSIAFSKDGSRIVVANHQGVSVWSASTFKQVGRSSSYGVVRRTTADGELVLADGAEPGRPLRILDIESGRLLAALPGPRQNVGKTIFSPDGRLVAATFEDNSIWIWDTRTGRKLGTLIGHKQRVAALAFSPDDSLLASGAADGEKRIWEVGSGRLRTKSVESGAAVFDASFSPDGGRLAWCAGQSVQVSDMGSGRTLLSVPLSGLGGATFTPDNTAIIAISWNGTMEIRDAQQGKLLNSLGGSRPFNGPIAFDPGRRLIATSDGVSVRVWDYRTAIPHQLADGPFSQPAPGDQPKGVTQRARLMPRPSIDVAKHYVAAVMLTIPETVAAFRKNGPAQPTGELWLWDEGGNPLPPWDPAPGYNIVRFSGSGELLAAVSQGNRVTVWSMPTKSVVAQISLGGVQVAGIGFSGDGRRLAGITKDGTVLVWDVATGKAISQLRLASKPDPDDLERIALSPDGTRLACGSLAQPTLKRGIYTSGLAARAPLLEIYDVASGRLSMRLELQGSDGSAPWPEFSPDGKRIAAVAYGIYVVDASTGSVISKMAGPKPILGFARFIPDGSRLATVDRVWGGLTLWDPIRGQAVLSLPDCIAAAIGQNGLTCLDGDRAVHVINLNSTHFPGLDSLVITMLEKHFLIDEAIRSLEADKGIDENLRKEAIRVLRTRGDSLYGLRIWAREVLTNSTARPEDYKLAYQRLQSVAKSAPPSIGLMSLWGWAQYRMGDYKGTLQTLSAAETQDRESAAVLAMAYERLGRHAEALDRLAALNKLTPLAPPSPENKALERLVRESKTLIRTGNWK